MLQLKSVDLKKEKIDTLIIPVCEDRSIHDSRMVASLVKKAKQLSEFKGRKNDEVILYNLPDIRAVRVMFLGVGKREKMGMETLRAFSGLAVKKSISKMLSTIWIAVPSEKKIALETRSILEATVEGAFLGNHIDDRYKEDKKKKSIQEINILVKPAIAKKYGELTDRVSTVCQGTIMAREWVNTPSNDKRPEQLAASIMMRAEKENLAIELFDEKRLKQEQFNTLLAVAQGSESEPRMLVLEYLPNDAEHMVVLVGKGVTFDSGGVNLKPSGSLYGMKADMAGAAAVAATLITIARLSPKINVVGIMPMVENMVSGKASRPGDVVKSYNGKTIEIGNTDAEGRLILIDAMAYAVKKYKPDMIIDIATLTGACVVALGEKIAGLFSFDDKLAETIIDSGQHTHERCWRLPLPEDYTEMLDSDIADIKNISDGRWGGSITAALFLAEFVKDTRWAHIDIAGPAHLKKGSDYCGPGGTGFGVRLFCNLMEKL